MAALRATPKDLGEVADDPSNGNGDASYSNSESQSFAATSDDEQESVTYSCTGGEQPDVDVLVSALIGTHPGVKDKYRIVSSSRSAR